MTSEPSPPAGNRAAWWVLCALAVAAFGYFRLDALQRVSGPFNADSMEYLLMARGPLTGEAMPVKDVRAGIFPALLAIPLWIRSLFLAEGAPLGHGPALIVPFLFAVLCVAGAWRLGRLVGGPIYGPWIALLAATFTALLPDFTFWSSDLLADVPSAACTIWALVFWVERRPVWTGFALGLAVCLRYQSLITLGVFLAVPFFGALYNRRFKDFGLTLLGIVPAAILLGVLDYLYWGAPFHTFMRYVPRQLTTFLPVDLVQKIFPVEAVTQMPRAPGNVALAEFATKPRDWYLTMAPTFATWVQIIPLALYPFARRKLHDRRGADFALLLVAFSLAVLSVQSFKETRYLLAVAPLFAVLAAVGTVWVASLAERCIRAPGPGLTKVVAWTLPVVVGLAGGVYAREAWHLQKNIQYRPFGAVTEAVNTFEPATRPTNLGLGRPWLLHRDHSFDHCQELRWTSADWTVFDFRKTNFHYAQPPAERDPVISRALDQLDCVVLPPGNLHDNMERWRWLNERMAFDGYFYDPHENRHATLRLVRVADRGSAPRPFWELDEPRAREAPTLTRFKTVGVLAGIETDLVELELEALETRGGLLARTRWRLPELTETTLVLEALIYADDGVAGRQKVGEFRDWIIPDDPDGRIERSGRPLRSTRYLTLSRDPRGLELLVEMRLAALTRVSGEVVWEQLVPEAEEAIEGELGWWLPLTVRVAARPE